MADGGGVPRRWQDGTDLATRSHVRAYIERKLAEMFATGSPIAPDGLRSLAATFEEGVFRKAQNQTDYMTNISMNFLNLEQSQQEQNASEDHQRQTQMAHGMQPGDAVQGGSSLFAVSPPRAVSSMAGPVRPHPPQLSNQHSAGPWAPDMPINVQHELSDIMAMFSQPFDSQPATVAPVAASVPCGQRIMQSPVSVQNQNQHRAVQLQPTSSAGSSQASVGQLHEQSDMMAMFAQPATVAPVAASVPCGQRIMQSPVSIQNQNQHRAVQPTSSAGSSQASAAQLHEQFDMMAMFGQPATVAPVAASIQIGRQIMQSPVSIQNQNQHRAVRLRPTSSEGCSQASVAQLQGRPVARPNAQPNHVLGQNASGVCDMQQQTTHMMMRNHQGLGVNQYHMNSQQFQSVGADVAHMNTGYPGGWNNQQSVESQSPFEVCEQEVLQKQANMEPQLITPGKQPSAVSQQSNVHYPSRSPQTSGTLERTGEVDWREEMFEQIKLWKDAYFLKFMELNRNVVITKITEEQLQSLPQDKADAYRRRSFVKNMTVTVLKLLQVQKNEIPEAYRGRLSKVQDMIHRLVDCHWQKIGQYQGTSKGHQSQDSHVKPQIIDLTGDTASFTGSKRLLKSPIVKSGAVEVASPSALLNSKLQLPIASPGSVAAPSPCASVKSTFTSTVEKSGVPASASPCSFANSTLPSNVAKSGVVPVASPCDSVKSAPSKDSDSVSCSLMDKNEKAAVGDCNQTTPSKQMTAAGQKEDQVRSGVETLLAKKRPIDRLLDEVRSSSPAVLGSSVNSMKSALLALDSFPLPPWRGPNTKLKRSYDLTASCSEFPLDTASVSGSSSSSELGAKRQKTQLQNARDALLDEIEAINRTLIDTVICINDVTDGITSCDDGGVLIKLSYSAVSVVPSLKSHLATSGFQPLVMPVTLFVPADYPASSPVVVDDGACDRQRTKLGCVSATVDAAFQRALRDLPEPRSLRETARAWDACVRQAATEVACRHGGGTMLGRWESCVGA